MNQEDKVEVLVASIRSRLIFQDSQEESLRNALEEGLSKVAGVEQALRKATLPYQYIEVGLEEKGFALWAAGGFDGRTQRGYAITAAGADVRPLKPYRLIQEINGRHLLLPLYQGCFIAKAKALPTGEPFVDLYHVIGFIGRDEKLYAKVQCLCNMVNGFVNSKMADGEIGRFSGFMESAAYMASRENNASTEYWW